MDKKQQQQSQQSQQFNNKSKKPANSTIESRKISESPHWRRIGGYPSRLPNVGLTQISYRLRSPLTKLENSMQVSKSNRSHFEFERYEFEVAQFELKSNQGDISIMRPGSSGGFVCLLLTNCEVVGAPICCWCLFCQQQL